jgi:hypothetical protein
MLAVRQTELPDGVQYFLDGASENEELTSAAFMVCTLYGETERLLAITDNPGFDRMSKGLHVRQEIGLELERYAVELARQSEPARAAAFAFLAIRSLNQICRGTAGWLAGWNYEDEIAGGCELPFRKRWRWNRDARPTPRIARRLRSPSAIRRYVKQTGHDSIALSRRRFEIWLDFGQPDIGPGKMIAALDELKAAAADVDAQRQIIRDKAADYFNAQIGGRATLPKSKIREIRRVTRKAALIASNIVGPEKVSAFARGQEVILPGQQFDVAVKPASSIARVGHGALTVAIRDKAGPELSKLCIYQERTPALDQLASLALIVAAGEEQSILETGNLYDTRDGAREHPALAARIAAREAKQAAENARLIGMVENAQWRPWDSNRDLMMERVREYEGEMLNIYLDAVQVGVFGPRVKHVRRMAA